MTYRTQVARSRNVKGLWIVPPGVVDSDLDLPDNWYYIDADSLRRTDIVFNHT